MKPICSKNPTLREFLNRSQYQVVPYHRGFVWDEVQITSFVRSLIDSFSTSYARYDSKTQAEKYPYHFLGTLWVAHENGEKIILDGFQRLVVLFLILVFARKVMREHGNVKLIDDMIHWNGTTNGAFNLNIPDAQDYLQMLIESSKGLTSIESTINQKFAHEYCLVESLLNNQFSDDKVMEVFVHWLSVRIFFVVNETHTRDSNLFLIFSTGDQHRHL